MSDGFTTLDKLKGLSDDQRKQIARLIEHTRTGMEKFPEQMMPAVLLFNTERHETNFVLSEFGDDSTKDVFAETVRMMAKQMSADMTVLVAESWSLEQEAGEEYQKNPHLYPNGMRDHPQSKEIVSFMVETFNGAWMARAEIIPKGEKRSMGEVEFLEADSTTGRFSSFLDRSNVH